MRGGLWALMLCLLGLRRASAVLVRGSVARAVSSQRRMRSPIAVAEGAAPSEPTRLPPKFVPFPFGYHEEIELTIDDLTNLGDGVGRVQLPPSAAAPAGAAPTQDAPADSDASEDADADDQVAVVPASTPGGWVVMIPFALPGEVVRARIFRNHAGYSSADLVEVLQPSPNRQQATCPLFGTCGGCQYQHLRYDAQLAIKGKQVEELLVRRRLRIIAYMYIQPTSHPVHISSSRYSAIYFVYIYMYIYIYVHIYI